MTWHVSVLRVQDGFTVVEMIVAAAITMTVTAAVFALMDPAQGSFAEQPEVVDMQQRLRVGVDVLARDLLMAGGGSAQGPLIGYLAPVLPYRVGYVDADQPERYFDDRLTVMYAPPNPAQSTLASAMFPGATEATIVTGSGCPAVGVICGFKEGMTVAVADSSGSWDAYAVVAVQPPVLRLRRLGVDAGSHHGAGAVVMQVELSTYWLKADPAAGTSQLMRYDGNQTDSPIAEDVAWLSFEYYGEAAPPQLKAGSVPMATYGPSPPEIGVDNPHDAWGAGENCLFAAAENVQFPRLEWLPGGSESGDGLVRLAPSRLTDGPWCPDAVAAGRYDADLLRVRRVGVRLRVRAAKPAFREAGARRQLADREVGFDVTPRNLSLDR